MSLTVEQDNFCKRVADDIIELDKKGVIKNVDQGFKLEKDLIKRMGNIINRKIYSAQAALFWFSNNYKFIDRYEGEVYFDRSDLFANNTIDAKGVHEYYDRYSDLSNRGRICVKDGKIEIWVGERCPASAVEIVKKEFGLNRLGQFPIVVIREAGYDRVEDSLEDRVVAALKKESE
jgi:hypothetical protein